jgi:hypothetical protein
MRSTLALFAFTLLLAPLSGIARAQASPTSKSSPLLDVALERAGRDASDMGRALRAQKGLPPSVRFLPYDIASKAATVGRELGLGAAVSVDSTPGRQQLEVQRPGAALSHVSTDFSQRVEVSRQGESTETAIVNTLHPSGGDVRIKKARPNGDILRRELAPLPEGSALPDGTKASAGSWSVTTRRSSGTPWRTQSYAIDGQRGVIKPKPASTKSPLVR